MDDVAWSIILVCIFAGASLFFSLNGLALRTFSRVKLQDAFKQKKKEELFDSFMESNESLLLTCLLFKLIADTGVVIVLAILFAAKGHLFSFILAVVIFEFFCLTIPHFWARYTGESSLAQTYGLIRALSVAAKPVLFLLKFNDSLVRRLAGVTETTPDQAQEEKQEEILSFVEQGKLEGVVDEEEMEMIENVLELSDSTADEIMTPRTDMVAVDIDDDLHAVLETITKAGHSRIPVYKENIDNITGLIYAKDLLAEIGKDPKDFKLHEKIRDAYFVPETKPLRVLLHEFQNQKLHIAIVLDEYGGTAGIVTIEDILEELVGEIVDEYEKTPPVAVKKIDETTIELEARIYIDDLNRDFELNLPEDEDYETVGGFVFSHLGYIPKTGETFDYDGMKFTIVLAETREIKRIRINITPG